MKDRSIDTSLVAIEDGIDRLAARSDLIRQTFKEEHTSSHIDLISHTMRRSIVNQTTVNSKTRHFVKQVR